MSWSGKRKKEHAEQVNFRCSKKDLRQLDELAVAYGTSKAGVIRMLVAREHEFLHDDIAKQNAAKPFSILDMAKKIAEAVD